MQDITQAFQLSCQALPSHFMVKRPSSTLLDAMNALLLFDPVLDTGLTAAQTTTFAPELSLADPQLCEIMDRMVQSEASWHNGSPLCDTVFSCMYYHNPESIASVPLQAFTLAYIKSIELAYHELSRGNLLDGEDIWLDHHGIPVQMADTVEDVLYILAGAIESEDCPDVLQRLQLRKMMLLALADFQPFPQRSFSLSSSLSPLPSFIRLSPYLRQSMPLPPIIECDPNTFVDQLALQLAMLNSHDPGRWQYDPTRPLLNHWQAYTDTDCMIPYIRSLAITRISAIDRPFELVTGMDPPAGIWRSVAEGCAIAMLQIPLQNRSRQRRSYLTVAHSWHERATSAFASGDLQASAACHALRLDCLLAATTVAYELDIYHPSEYTATMWWIYRLTSARGRIGWNLLSEIWRHIAEGMLKLLMESPIAEGASRDRFQLRHKWPRRPPYPKQGRGLVPRWKDWEHFTIADLSSRSASELLEMAELLLDGVPLEGLKEEVSLNRRTAAGSWRRGKHLYIR